MTKKKVISLAVAVVALLAVVGGVFAWRTSNQKRTYEQALAAYDSEDFQTAANLFESLGNYEDSETRYQSCQYELTVDRRFLRTMATGLENRWDDNSDTTDTVAMQKLVESELANLKEFKNASFDDANLQQEATAYIGALEKSLDALTYSDTDLWNRCYIQRGQVIVDLYNNYALPIDSQYDDTLRAFVNDVKTAESQQAELSTLKDILKNNMTLELSAPMAFDGYLASGSAELCLDNTSAYDLDDMYVELYYYTSDGKKTTDYTNTFVTAFAGQSVQEPLDLYVDGDNYDPNGYWEISYPSISCTFNDNWYEKLFTE